MRIEGDFRMRNNSFILQAQKPQEAASESDIAISFCLPTDLLKELAKVKI